MIEIFLYNTGNYHGTYWNSLFAFMKVVPTNLIPIPTEFHELIDREIPTVFVKMDLPIGYSISKTIQNEYHLLITTDDDI